MRDQYVPQSESEALAEKFDRALGFATADREGFRTVSRSDPVDDETRTTSPATAAAKFDRIFSEPRKSGAAAALEAARFAAPTSDADLEDTSSDEPPVDERKPADAHPEVATQDDGDDRSVDDEADDRSVDDDHEIEDEPERESEQKPRERKPPKATNPAKRPPSRRRSGRGVSKKPPRARDFTASTNPLEEEAVSTAATELAPHPGQDGGSERLDDDDRRAIEDFLAIARSPATLATYRDDLRQFSEWCAGKGIRSFPAEPDVVASWAGFLARKKRLKFSQIDRKVSAISAAHVALKHDSPCLDSVVKNVMLGIKSGLEADHGATAAITPADLRAIMTDAPRTMRWRRNKAMLLLGFSAGLRKSELVEVRIEGLRFDDDGLFMAIPGRIAQAVETVKIPKVQGKLCTVGAVARWIAASGITGGYLFRSVHDDGVVDIDQDRHVPEKLVTKIVKQAVKIIGLDPQRYTSKSLRIGYAEAVHMAAQKTIKDVDHVRQTIRPQTL